MDRFIRISYQDFFERFPTEPTIVYHDCNRIVQVWRDGDEILCSHEDVADALASLIELLYEADTVNTGYYDPAEDKRNGEEDDLTGWYYVNI